MEEPTLKPVALNPPLNVTLITDLSSPEMDSLLAFMEKQSTLQDTSTGLDLETTVTKDYFWRRMRTLQVGAKHCQFVVDLLVLCDGDSELLYNCQGDYGKNLHLAPKLQQFFKILVPYITERKILLVGVNLSFEYECLYWLAGIRIQHLFCCSIVERCISAGYRSLKDYAYFGMAEMVARYFGQEVDKSLQESFNLADPLTWEQVEYAALDTRLPLGLKAVQTLIIKGMTYKGMVAAKNPAAQFLKNIDPLLTGDNLEKIVQVENDAIGAFEDMHIHGERIDRDRWLTRIAGKKQDMHHLITKVLDPIFLPIVGSKHDQFSNEAIEKLTADWKALTVVSDAELKLKAEIRWLKKTDPAGASELEFKRLGVEAARKDEKERLKKIAGDASKRRTAIKNLAADCEGEALVNYGSDAQLLKILITMKGLASLTSLDDEVLEKYEKYPVMVGIRKYHGLSKEIGTYGDQWATEWKTKPCKEEGWLHPGDGRLHCTFNQYNAETGRSSSERPNAQNLPQDPEVRECFIADPPDESIRISVCCEADTITVGSDDPDVIGFVWRCTSCQKDLGWNDTKGEENVIVTCDMAGAELRILAEMADDPLWCGAFARDEDVHSVGTEMLYEEEWPIKQLPTCAYYKLHTEETVSKNSKCTLGEPQRQKCKCPEHKDMRDENKSANFLIVYGGGPGKLAKSIKKTLTAAKELLGTHERKNPKIWACLRGLGNSAKINKKAFDMFGRRRLFPEPTFERAREYAKSDREEKLRLSKEQADLNIEMFEQVHKRKPSQEEVWDLKHRQPTNKEVNQAYQALHSSIGRQGQNHPFQSTNATVIKLGMGCGTAPDGTPYLWHSLPKYRARLIKMVHDELVLQCPKRHGQKVAALVGEAFRKAAGEKMSKVVMEFDYHIGPFWQK